MVKAPPLPGLNLMECESYVFAGYANSSQTSQPFRLPNWCVELLMSKLSNIPWSIRRESAICEASFQLFEYFSFGELMLNG